MTRVEICLLLCKNWLSGGVDPEEKGGAVQGPFRPRRQSIGPQTMGENKCEGISGRFEPNICKKKKSTNVCSSLSDFMVFGRRRSSIYICDAVDVQI